MSCRYYPSVVQIETQIMKCALLAFIALLYIYIGSIVARLNIPLKDRPPIEWSVPDLPYRILVEVPAVDIGNRTLDELPAALRLDYRSLGLPGPIDLDSIQVFRYDPSTGKVMSAPTWPFSRSPGERASRFLDMSWPWDFPLMRSPEPKAMPLIFPRGAYLANVQGKGNPGLLTWSHTQEGNQPSFYAIYFNLLTKGKPQKVPRQGFIGDGSPRRDIGAAASPNTSLHSPVPLTGTLYNSIAVDDWDGDGLPDLIVGNGIGNIILFKNQGTRTRPKFVSGEYIRDAEGQILNVGSMACPLVVDWNGDGLKDLIVGEEATAGVIWFQNVGTNTDRKLTYRGHIKADGKDIVVPAQPCPESPHYKKDYAPAVEAVDWNGDGKLDLLLGGYITGHIWYYENIGTNPDGTPKLSFRGPLEADGKPIDTIWGARPCAVDLNGDGKPDLLTGSLGQKMGGGDTYSHFLLYYENIGSRTNPKLTERRVEYDGPEPRDILAQPRPLIFNDHGLVDLAISTLEHVYLAKNVGTKRSPKWKVELQEGSWGLSPLSATQLLDWNGDGQLDLIRSPMDDNDNPQPTVQLNKGLGSQGIFDSPKPLLPPGQRISHPAPYGDQWNFIYLYDFDGDGTLDLLWADGPGYAYLHRNKGNNKNPNFDTKGEKLMTIDGQPIKVGPPVVPIDKITDFTIMQGSRAGIAAADFNSDGKTDIVMGDTYGDIYYFENIGDNLHPLFARGVKLGNLTSRAIPLVYDWDHDGQVDVLGVSWSGRMEWYRNLGPDAKPQFAPGRPLDLPPTVPFSPRLLIADWNGDGDDDFLVMSSYPWFCWLDGSYVRHGYAYGRIILMEYRGNTTHHLFPKLITPLDAFSWFSSQILQLLSLPLPNMLCVAVLLDCSFPCFSTVASLVRTFKPQSLKRLLF